MEDNKKVYSIHFPGKQVYVDSTVYTFDEKIKQIKDDKDHSLYFMFQNIQIQKFERKVLVKKR